MTRTETEEFARRLAADTPCFPRGLSELERTDYAMMVPGFGGMVARSFAQAAGAPLSLPDIEWWPAAVRQAYLHWSGLIDDPDITEVELLSLPENFDQRTIVACLLVCPEATDQIIAEYLDCSARVPQLFHDLFFNVRSRLEEPLFIIRLLEEIGGARPLPQRFLASWATDLLELALRTRRMSDVLTSAFSRRTAPLADASQLRSEIREELLHIAAAPQSQGGEEDLWKTERWLCALSTACCPKLSPQPSSDWVSSWSHEH